MFLAQSMSNPADPSRNLRRPHWESPPHGRPQVPGYHYAAQAGRAYQQPRYRPDPNQLVPRLYQTLGPPQPVAGMANNQQHAQIRRPSAQDPYTQQRPAPQYVDQPTQAYVGSRPLPRLLPADQRPTQEMYQRLQKQQQQQQQYHLQPNRAYQQRMRPPPQQRLQQRPMRQVRFDEMQYFQSLQIRLYSWDNLTFEALVRNDTISRCRWLLQREIALMTKYMQPNSKGDRNALNPVMICPLEIPDLCSLYRESVNPNALPEKAQAQESITVEEFLRRATENAKKKSAGKGRVVSISVPSPRTTGGDVSDRAILSPKSRKRDVEASGKGKGKGKARAKDRKRGWEEDERDILDDLDG